MRLPDRLVAALTQWLVAFPATYGVLALLDIEPHGAGYIGVLVTLAAGLALGWLADRRKARRRR
ncbi:MAG TPA: hypothetical protein VGE07_24975 [Herpetosiphonaceae bacterium]